MNCYIYAIVVDGVVRYIGKGTGRRYKDHFAIARRIARERADGKRVKASYFHNKLSKALRAGSDVGHRILHSGLSDEAAYRLEVEAIAAAPSGQLWNRWVGGFGKLAASPELKRRLSEAALKRYEDPEQRRVAREMLSAVARDPQVRAMTSERQKSRFAAGDPAMKHWHEKAHRPESYAKRNRTLKQTLASRPDLRNKVAEWRKSHMAEHAASLKAAHARPEVKAKRRAYYDSPEGRRKLKAASEARWAKHRTALMSGGADCSLSPSAHVGEVRA